MYHQRNRDLMTPGRLDRMVKRSVVFLAYSSTQVASFVRLRHKATNQQVAFCGIHVTANYRAPYLQVCCLASWGSCARHSVTVLFSTLSHCVCHIVSCPARTCFLYFSFVVIHSLHSPQAGNFLDSVNDLILCPVPTIGDPDVI